MIDAFCLNRESFTSAAHGRHWVQSFMHGLIPKAFQNITTDALPSNSDRSLSRRLVTQGKRNEEKEIGDRKRREENRVREVEVWSKRSTSIARRSASAVSPVEAMRQPFSVACYVLPLRRVTLIPRPSVGSSNGDPNICLLSVG
uniref:Uncharacterized protein n=1 Tax=Vespula pensylvanica TaxID=30213 RepID=A0A834KSW0_VESPE|nr:hypothetical protein H0235_013261 [Vespula pensylvanica]